MKNKITSFATGILVLLLLPMSQIKAAPLPHYFAYNNKTQQCGEYWQGDGLERYNLPNKDWVYDKDSQNINSFEDRCLEMGYEYIGNLSTAGNKVLLNYDAFDDNGSQQRVLILLLCCLTGYLGLLAVTAGVVVLIRRKKS